ncbi:hypothetical protein JR316_0003396 [Psilocybe cubensis]|uniref:BRCT domain-containing protein n=2 Tax=Psilocybe cubensis TaxID=181762 RepID=A0A8H7Y0N5_PSICU|nr:hypothetical protein JR316_0003396 [Psilocybe cubensis]KAH9483918.1 hypothetical protein JR316_0003396 [Psilocybe cubensis]
MDVFEARYGYKYCVAPPSYPTSSDANEESQATQLLQELLDQKSSPIKRPEEDRNSAAYKTRSAHTNEISSDSITSSRNSNSLPHYHFHGLASTQTESQQQGEDEQANEGSQKENIGSLKQTKDFEHSSPSLATRPGSPYQSSSRNVQTRAGTRAQAKGSAIPKEKTTNKKAPTTVAFQSPQAKPSTSNTRSSKPVTRQSPYKPTLAASRYKPVQRRSSSEDSFAQDPELDEQLFIARSEKFNIPISELARNSSPEPEAKSPPMFQSRSSGRMPQIRGMDSPHGRILVEATPSQSTSSQKSHHIEETQISEEPQYEDMLHNPLTANRHVEDVGYQSSEHSSSYGEMAKEPEQELQPTQPSTQLQLEQTQPSTQVEESDILAPLSVQSPFSINPSHAAGPSTVNSGPRSLLALVNPGALYRYSAYRQDEKHLHRRATGGWTVPEKDLHLQRATSPPNAVSRRSNLPPPHAKRGFSDDAFAGSLSPEPMDVDIVPDSEPLRNDVELSSRRTRNSAPGQPSANPGLPKSNQEPVKVADMCPPPEAKLHPVPAEDEDEDEDGVPLATVIAAKRPRGRPPKNPPSKGKGKTLNEAGAKVRYLNALLDFGTNIEMTKATAVAPPSKEKKTQKRVTGGSWETGVVPSSVPDQDEASAPRGIIDIPKKKPPASRQSTRSTSAAPKSGENQWAASELKTNNDKPAEVDITEEEEEEESGPSRKRKRTAQTKAAPATRSAKGVAKRVKRETATPGGGRQAKNLRSTHSTATRLNNEPGTRVFALWKQDGHYYSGTVHSAEPGNQYLIHFDDTTSNKVTLEQMRLCRLQIGDQVIVANTYRPTKVLSVEVDGDDITVGVNLEDGVKQVPLIHLRIANKTITYEWKDRVLTADAISTTIKPVRAKLSPSPSKLSIASFPAMRGPRKKVLNNTALIVTLSAVNGSWEREKEKVVNAVKNSGGLVVDDMSTIIRMEGKHSANNNRWIIRKNDVQWVGDEDIARLFLLADEPNQKPKFLIALALGIPCLSTTWLHESVENNAEKEWTGYLLPQGFSPALKARISQQVDVDWGNSFYQLKDIMSNAVACKLFADKSILCVGPEMVCQPKGKRRAVVDDKAQEATNAIPQIILAMGADRVEAVTDVRYATHQLQEYDYLVIREKHHYSPGYSQCPSVVDWTWVKECLIASRYLTTPSWGEDSQEA